MSEESNIGAMLSPQRPGVAGALANVFTFAWRALLKIKHMPEQLSDVTITPIMFTVLFTFLFGGAIAGSVQAYLHFLLPGILVQTVLFSSVYTGFILNTDISKGIYDRFRSMPVWRPAPLVGALVGDSVRFTAASTVALVCGMVLGYRPGSALGVVAAILLLDLFALGVGWIFIVMALLVRTPATVMTLSWTVLMPLTFATNIYVDPETMPTWLERAVEINPVTHLVTAVRGLVEGKWMGRQIALSLAAPALLTAICAPIAVRIYRKRT